MDIHLNNEQQIYKGDAIICNDISADMSGEMKFKNSWPFLKDSYGVNKKLFTELERDTLSYTKDVLDV